ncbi:MAG: NADP(H)-dependent aldo-keto reductase [Bacteroidota bacterium]
MKYSKLGKTNLDVSKICLGTMTYGQQNTEAEAHEQMDYALEKGINFFDTAELYAVPSRKENNGLTEKYIGTWFKDRKNRDQVILATKITGPSKFTYIREQLDFSPDQIRLALEGSLQRLQTDYVDLYQLHWPERKTNYFGKREFEYDPTDPWEDNIEQVLETLQALQQEGKIRHIGVSNETPWGLHRYLSTSDHKNLPRIASIQNPYNLLNRTFEVGLSEIAIREKVGLLAYSPLGFGVLSGKYLGGKKPVDGRVTLFPNYSRYSGPNSVAATEQYQAIAQDNGWSLAQMALAFINQQAFITANIIGATKMAQLKENISSIDITLSDEVLKRIQAVHNTIPNPAP